MYTVTLLARPRVIVHTRTHTHRNTRKHARLHTRTYTLIYLVYNIYSIQNIIYLLNKSIQHVWVLGSNMLIVYHRGYMACIVHVATTHYRALYLLPSWDTIKLYLTTLYIVFKGAPYSCCWYYCIPCNVDSDRNTLNLKNGAIYMSLTYAFSKAKLLSNLSPYIKLIFFRVIERYVYEIKRILTSLI